MNTDQFWNWRTAIVASIAAPISVLLHEFAHIGAMELGGVSAELRGFSMGMPVGYLWNFAGLESARTHYGVPSSVFVFAALAGPMTTLIIGFVGLFAYRCTHNLMWATSGLAAILLRTVGTTFNMPRFIDGSMDTSDEAIAAHFMEAPLSSLYWPSLFLGYLCVLFILKSVSRADRVSLMASVFVGGAIGYFGIDALANLLIFKPDIWVR